MKKRTFIESPQFRRFVDDYKRVGLLRAIQEEILSASSVGEVIPGTGGVRKGRYIDVNRGKGKRGGLRYLFLDIPNVEKTYLIAIYDKGEKIDISPDEKKAIKRLVQTLKTEVE